MADFLTDFDGPATEVLCLTQYAPGVSNSVPCIYIYSNASTKWLYARCDGPTRARDKLCHANREDMFEEKPPHARLIRLCHLHCTLPSPSNFAILSKSKPSLRGPYGLRDLSYDLMHRLRYVHGLLHNIFAFLIHQICFHPSKSPLESRFDILSIFLPIERPKTEVVIHVCTLFASRICPNSRSSLS